MKCVSFCFVLCCILAVAFGQIEPIVETKDDSTMLFLVISELNRDLQISNYLTFSGIKHQRNVLQNVPSVQQSLMESLNGTVIVAGSGMPKLHNIYSRNMAIVFFNGIDDPILSAVHTSLENLRSMWIIFVYKSNAKLLNNSIFKQIFFTWCYNMHIHKTILLMRSNGEYEIWSYEFKSTIRVLKFSPNSIRPAISIKICVRGEMKKPRSSVFLYQSLPDVFAYNSSKGVHLGGGIGILLETFFANLQGSVNISVVPFAEYMERVSQGHTEDRHIDIGANMLSNFARSLYSPVWRVTQMCLVLPNERRNFIQYFGDVYDTKFSVMCFMAFYTLLNAVMMWIINPQTPLADIFFNALRLTTGQGRTGREFRRLRLPAKFIEIFTHIFTILVLSIIGGAVTTALITGLRKPKIVDTETFLESGLRVMVHSYQVQEEYNFLPPEIQERFIFVSKSERDRHIFTLNDSYAYLTLTHKWNVLEYIQRRLSKPKLRLANEKLCSAQRYIKLYVCSSVCYFAALKDFAITAHEFSLTSKWMEQGLRQAEEAGLIAKEPYEPLTERPLPLKFYEISYELYSFFLLLSLMTFFFECLIGYWRNANTVISI